MYRILIKYNSSGNTTRQLFELYGSSTVATGSTNSVFTPFETDDETVLEETILALSKEIGSENIMAIKVLDTEYKVDVVIGDVSEDNTNTEDTNTDDTTDTGSDTNDNGTDDNTDDGNTDSGEVTP